jgi:hypothetical protein
MELPFTYEAVVFGIAAAAWALPVAEVLAFIFHRRPVHQKLSDSEKRWRRTRFVLSDILGGAVTLAVIVTTVYFSAVWLGRTGRSTSAARNMWIFASFVATVVQVILLPIVASWVWMIVLVAARNVGALDWLLLLFPSLMLETEDLSKAGLSSLSSSEQLLDSIFDAEDQIDDALFDAVENAGEQLNKLASSLSRSWSKRMEGEGGVGFTKRKENKFVGDIMEDAYDGLDNDGRVMLEYRGAAGDDAWERKKSGTDRPKAIIWRQQRRGHGRRDPFVPFPLRR